MSYRRANLRFGVQVLAPLAGTSVLVAVLLVCARTLGDGERQLERIDAALIELHALEAFINAQFASVGNHLTSGSEESLAPYRDVDAVDASFAKVRTLVYDNPGQRVHVDNASDRYHAWRRFADNQIGLVLAGRLPASAMRRAAEPVERAVSEALELTDHVERQRQTERADRLAAARRRLLLLIPIGGLVLAIGLSVLGTMQLSSLASEGATKYQELADKHADALHEHGQVQAQVDELDQLVQERTANLKAVTGQLEALTYAVSRHLRGGLEQADTLLRDVWYESLGGPIDRDALRRLALEVSSARRLLEALLTCAALTRLD